MNKLEQMPPFCQTDVVCSPGNYLEFLEKKRHSIGDFGFKPNYIPEIAFDFQKAIIEKSNMKDAKKRVMSAVKTLSLFDAV